MFEYLFGFALLVLMYGHTILFRKIAVDKIYPECFRQCKYGACDYYSEFYDPVKHKTEQPFQREVVKNEAMHLFSLGRKDYNFPFNLKLNGISLINTGNAYTDYVKKAPVESLQLTDTNWVIKNKLDSPKPSSSQSTLQKRDVTKDLRPLT